MSFTGSDAVDGKNSLELNDSGEAEQISVIDEIRQAIVQGEFAPGQRLVEPDLCSQFDVSRGTIRLVLFELAKEGLVEQEQNRGSRVRSLTLAEAIHVIEVRMAIEGYFAGRAAELATRSDLVKLQETIDLMQQQLRSGNLRDFDETTTHLQELIVGVSLNAAASQIVSQLRNQSAREQFRVQMRYGRQEALLTEHKTIVDAIVRQDAAGACEAMHTHLRNVMAALLGSARRGESTASQNQRVADSLGLPR